MQDKGHILAFIVGMSRGGTTFMETCMNNHPDVVAFGETAYWGRQYITPENDGRYTSRQIDQILTRWDENWFGTPKPFQLWAMFPDQISQLKANGCLPHELFDLLAQGFCQHFNKPFAIEKTPHHIHSIDKLAGVYPDAKFIVMFRSAYEFMVSYKYQGQQSENRVRQTFKKIYHPFTASMVWKKYAAMVNHATSHHAQRAMIVPTDSLKEDAPEQLRRIMAFLGLGQHDPAQVIPESRNTSFPDGVRPEPAASDLFWMNLIAGRYIKHKRPVPKSPGALAGIGLSVLSLPFRLVIHIFIMRKNSSTSMLSYLRRYIR